MFKPHVNRNFYYDINEPSENLVLSMYVPSKPFTCLDGSATIPFEFVNDDYCDCRGKLVMKNKEGYINGFLYR